MGRLLAVDEGHSVYLVVVVLVFAVVAAHYELLFGSFEAYGSNWLGAVAGNVDVGHTLAGMSMNILLMRKDVPLALLINLAAQLAIRANLWQHGAILSTVHLLHLPLLVMTLLPMHRRLLLFLAGVQIRIARIFSQLQLLLLLLVHIIALVNLRVCQLLLGSCVLQRLLLGAMVSSLVWGALVRRIIFSLAFAMVGRWRSSLLLGGVFLGLHRFLIVFVHFVVIETVFSILVGVVVMPDYGGWG